MTDESLRLAKPADLEQLAKLIEGKGNLQDRLDEAFTRASTLGVRDKLAPINPMTSWVTKTGPDLRRRAAIIRAGDGDPLAAALYAGWTPEQLKDANLPPDIMLIANASVANGSKFDPSWLKKQDGETLSDWITRIKGDAVAKVTNNENLGEVVSDYIELTALASTVPEAFKLTVTGTLGLYKYFKKGEFLKAPGTTIAQILKGKAPSYIPAGIARQGAAIGARTPSVILNVFTGADNYAALAGKQWAWEASLLKVGKGAAALKTATGGSRLAAFASGAGAAAKTAGWWRAAGIGGSIAATGIGAFDLVQQGNPIEAFKKDKAGYIADVSGVAFNASLTAAMIAPNPVTIGAAAVTGLVYGVSSIVDNWDKVKQFPGKVADAGRWAGDKVKEGAGKLVSGGKSLAKKLNPFG
ncbi:MULTISPECIES: mucin-2 [Streptomyces]|uniref:mucin-2 n=1 Tax=Streptomyces TaxID=1883 RepID=UPI0013DA10FA|nr:mucin-2 [Streptomyces aureoverticillatus]QIB44229.1 mucin-2 [Streptomyces aureoverticillatus]